MDWQSIIAFCVSWHVVGAVVEELRKLKSRSEMDQALRALRNISAELDRHDSSTIKRVK